MIISEHVRGKAFSNDIQRANAQDRLHTLRSSQVLTTYRLEQRPGLIERHALSIDDPTELDGGEFDAATARKRSASFPFVNNIPNFYRNEMMRQHYVAPSRKYFNLTTRVLESNALAEKFKRDYPHVIRTVRDNRAPYQSAPNVPSQTASANNTFFQLKRISDRLVTPSNTSNMNSPLGNTDF
jgi:hypothetical protein